MLHTQNIKKKNAQEKTVPMTVSEPVLIAALYTDNNILNTNNIQLILNIAYDIAIANRDCT